MMVKGCSLSLTVVVTLGCMLCIHSVHATRAAIGPAPRFFTQNQDHFDGTNTNTWNQAYYVNDTFWKAGSDAPVFLCVGGEGPPIDGSVVVASVHCNVAVEYLQAKGALMFAVEHRYYGCHNMSACPVTSFEGQALRYLSSRQALADLAKFHAYAVATYNLTSSNKWISFGGSYPGMLAGWFRLKFPHLVHGAVASSAPVQADVDMQGYNDVVAQAYAVSDNNVGGSAACRQAIADGHATIKNMFNSEAGRTTLASLFGHQADWYKLTVNQAAFAGYGVAYFPAQGNDPSCTQAACNIKKVCAIMTDASLGDNVHRLAAVRNQQSTYMSAAELAMSNKLRPLAPVLSSRYLDGLGELPDFWGYQVCTEFGFFQTCEVGSQCFFAQGYATLESQMAMCPAEFQIPETKVKENIAYSDVYYGGLSNAGSCLLYPNGEVDPWHSQSILNSTNPDLEVLWVPGASHHAWTHPSAPSDQPSVVSARKAIRQFIDSVLNKPCSQVQ
eukprot:m.89520 g.89520  ORF g.89520 m.89520 type:complete len:500 (+) comp12897_c0_seq1:211-1710(+)